MESTVLISNQLKFIIFICFQIPSIICHLFLIYYLIDNKQLRKSLRNHVILLFLIVNGLLITIDLSIILHFLRFSQIEENSINLCKIWNFLDSFLSNLSAFLMMWASAERHILIFYVRQIYNTNFKRFFLHYIPLCICVVYAFLFYFISIYAHPICSNEEHFHYDEIFCGRACYVHEDFILSTIDLIFNRITCCVFIFVFNISLLIRVLYEKRQRNQIIRWRRHKKMMIQVLSISTLYLIGTLPSSIAELIHIFTLNEHGEEESAVQEEIFLYLYYFISIFIPFICLMSLPEAYKKIPLLFCYKRTATVTPHVAWATQQQPGTVIRLTKRTTAMDPTVSIED